MTNLRVAVSPVAEDRFAVLVLDAEAGQVKQGPDGGQDHKGYTVAELRPVLRDCYGMAEAEITERIAAADARRASEG